MREYSPRRRTALVLMGTGTAGAYHAGVLRALDESGVKLDLVVGSGIGTLGAAFAAAGAGANLYGAGGFWDGISWDGLYRLRPLLRVALVLVGLSLCAMLLPVAVALLVGLCTPFLLLADLVRPGTTARVLSTLWDPGAFAMPYLAAVALPVVALLTTVLLVAAVLWFKDRRRFPEFLESALDPGPARERLALCLGTAVRGVGSTAAGSDTELGRRFVALAGENLGQPGFRELILRAADLDRAGPLVFTLLDPAGGAGRDRGAVDLRAPDYAPFAFDALLSGLLLPLLGAPRRITFPRGGVHAGETHRLCDATVAGGSGISEALAAGAEQVVLVTACPEEAAPSPQRRGPRGLASGLLSTLERQAVDRELRDAERLNRMVETLGHDAGNGARAWEDPATGRVYRLFSLYVVRPERRGVGPLEFDGALDPVSEVWEHPGDLLDLGYRDAYRLFVEPVVGAGGAPAEKAPAERAAAAVEL